MSAPRRPAFGRPDLRMVMYRHPRARAAVRKAMNAAFNVATRPGLHEHRVVAGPMRGARMLLDLHSEEKRYWLNLYEPWVQRQIVGHTHRDTIAWDVGAFVGFHTLLFARLGARVIAMEPDPANRRRLLDNIALNRTEHITVLDSAVGATPGTVYMVESNEEPSQNRVARDGAIAVSARTLDDISHEFGVPSIVKMDIEGAEHAALLGGEQVLERARPIWILELHGAEGLEALAALEAAGYRIRGTDDRIPPRDLLASAGRTHIVALP